MQEVIIIFIGIITVFLVFTILYFIFCMFGFFSKKASIKLPKKLPPSEKILDEEDEKAAIIAAIYSMIGDNIKIKSIKRIKRQNFETRGWEYWKKSGWRGVKRWYENLR